MTSLNAYKNPTLDWRTQIHQCLAESNYLMFREKAIPIKHSEEGIQMTTNYFKPAAENSPHKNIYLTQKPALSEKNKPPLEPGNALKITLVALSVCAIAVSIFYLLDDCYNHPRNDFLLNKASPDRLMSKNIKSFGQLDNLKEINGVKISTIEARARPYSWATTGFLGQKDGLVEVMKKDWKTVEKLGTTHIELANHLESIWSSFERVPEHQLEKKDILYDPSILNENTIHSKPQKLECKMISYCGQQSDIFCNRTDGVQDPFPPCWTEDSSAVDIKIKNLRNNEEILLAYGVKNYIRKYGFYEGGETNPYRVDPIRLAAVLTGKSYCRIAQAIDEPCK